MFGKKKPEDLTGKELEQIVDRLMDNSAFRSYMTVEVRHTFLKDINTRQIVLDKVNVVLDNILNDENNLANIKECVIKSIEDMQNVKILLDRIPHTDGGQR